MSFNIRANSSSSNINSEKLIYGGDVNTQHIMMMIDKGIKKNMRMIKTDRARLAKKIYNKIRFLRTLVIFLFILLIFFEKPDWCLRNDD